MNEHSANVVVSFNDCINRRDLVGLSKLMTTDHVFIDSANNTISGKERCVEACDFIQPAAGKDLSWSINSMTGKLSISHGSAGRPCRSIKTRLA